MATPVAAPATTARTRFGFVLALATIGAMMVGASAPSPFYPVMQDRMGFSATITSAVFAVYAGALLGTLLVAGSVSDHLGRRPVIAAALILLASGLAIFWHADAIGALFVARVIQGVASGLLLSSTSAAVTDLAPPGRSSLAAIWNSAAPLLGLAVGAAASGEALDRTTAAATDVFGPLVVLYLLLAAAIWSLPETAPRHEGLLASLRPRVALPGPVRPVFWRSVPAIVAGWATSGLYLSLGPLIMASSLGAGSHLLQGLVVTLLSGVGAVAAMAAGRRTARQTTLYGTVALGIGTLLTLAAVAAHTPTGYLAAVVVAGTGFGTAFFGVMGSITPLTQPGDRAEVFSAVFIASYLAFGVPTVLAGLAVPVLGLTTTTYAYGIMITILTLLAAALRWRSRQ